jgi:hypothetical protein
VAVIVRELVGRRRGRWVDLALDRRLAWVTVTVTLVGLEINQQMHTALLTAH